MNTFSQLMTGIVIFFTCKSMYQLFCFLTGIFLKDIYLFIYLFGSARSQLWYAGSFLFEGAACDPLVGCCGIFQYWHVESLVAHAGSWVQHVGSSFLTRGQTHAPCIGSKDSQPLDHQGSPSKWYLLGKISLNFLLSSITAFSFMVYAFLCFT